MSPIHIPDCTKEGLQEILRYAHYEEAQLTGSNVMEVFYLAKKYMMLSLEEKCQHYIQNEVGAEDVLSVLSQVQKMGDENLEKHFWDIVDSRTEEVIVSESFVNVPRELLYQICKRDTLRVDELNLFKAVDKWATKRIEEDKKLVCNGETKRAILGEDIIRLIRFPLITGKTIAEVVLPCDILDKTEVAVLFSVFVGAASQNEIFSTKSRSSAEPRISDARFTRFQGPWSYSSGTKDCLDFSVGKTVNLIGVRLFGSQGNTYNVVLNINKSSTQECISTISSSYATEKEMIDGLYYGFTVTLDKPVRLDPGIVYNIQAQIKGPNSCSGDAGRSVVSAGNDITITYQNASHSPNGTSHIIGQFPSLVLQTI